MFLQIWVFCWRWFLFSRFRLYLWKEKKEQKYNSEQQSISKFLWLKVSCHKRSSGRSSIWSSLMVNQTPSFSSPTKIRTGRWIRRKKKRKKNSVAPLIWWIDPKRSELSNWLLMAWNFESQKFGSTRALVFCLELEITPERQLRLSESFLSIQILQISSLVS